MSDPTASEWGDPLTPARPVVTDELVARAGAGARTGARGPTRWLVRRLLMSVVILFLVSVVVFAATQLLPSDPAQAILGRDATPASVAALQRQLGLDRPVLDQYGSWLGGVVTGDLGRSLSSRAPVSDTVGPAFVNSIALLAISAVIALPLSIGLAASSALRRDGLFDRLGLSAALALSAVPEFVIGIVLTILLATTVVRLLPAVASGDSPLAQPSALVLPVLTLVLAVIPYLYRLLRASLIEILEADYVQMARMKGLPARLVLRRHALPNALAPTIQAAALVLAYLLSGVVVIEYLFRYPGLGTTLADAVNNRDLPVIQAVVMIYAAAIAVLNLVADLLTVLVSPRLRQELR